MRKSGLIWFVLFFTILSSCKKEEDLSDADKKQFLKTYGTASEGVDLVQTSDGGYVMLGNALGENTSDIYLKKVDAFGNDVWSKTYEYKDTTGSRDESASSIILLPDGRLAIVGSSNSSAFIQSTFLLVTSANGTELWNEVYNSGISTESETGHGLTISPSGNILFSSIRNIEKQNKAYQIGFVRHISATDYSLIDTARADLSPPDTSSQAGFNIGLKDILVTGDGYLVATGYSDKPGEDGSTGVGLVLSRYEPSALGFTKNFTFGGLSDDNGQSIIETSSGDVVISGYQTEAGARKFMAYSFSDVSVLSPFPQWNYLSTADGDAEVNAIVEVSDGFILSGYNEVAGNRQFYIEKINSGGTSLIWSKQYGYVDFDEAKSVISTSDGGLAVLGTTSDERGNTVMTLLKLDANGNLK